MRIVRVEAGSFGALEGAVLEFAPGMTVVWGHNEAGKSTWQHATFAALCGRRRGPGRRQDGLDRYRPWDRDRWQVSTVVELDDGRRIELRHDLDGLVDCQAIDLTTGADVSAELITEGTPDGSRLLGLEREVAWRVLLVRQAEVLLAGEDGATLRDQLQRAAAAGSERTAAEAVARLQQERDRIGVRRGSTKPMGRAYAEVEERRRQLEAVRARHQRYLEVVEELAGAEAELAACEQEVAELTRALEAAEEAERRREALRARAQAQAELRDIEQALAQRQQLAARRPAGPRPEDPEAELRAEVEEVLEAWAQVHPPAPLEGPTAAQLAAELEALPPAPEGDLEPDPRVEQAVERWRRTVAAAEVAAAAARRGRMLAVAGAVLLAAGLASAAVTLPIGAALGAVGALLVVLGWVLRPAPVDVEGAAAAVAAAIRGRGDEASSDPEAAWESYREACRRRAEQAHLAARRPLLAERLAQRRAAEQQHAAAVARFEELRQRLIGLADRVGVWTSDAAADVVAERLSSWLADSRRRAEAIAEAQRRWDEAQQAAARLAALEQERPTAELERRAAELRAQLATDPTPGHDTDVDATDPDLEGELDRATLEAALEEARRSRDAVKARCEQLRGRRQQVAADHGDVAAAEEALAEAQRRLETLQRTIADIEEVCALLEAAAAEVHRDVAPALNTALSRYLPRITAGRYTEALVDPATLAVRVRERDGQFRPAEALSRGTAEQIYLLLRTVIGDRLATTGERVPLLLDDVTVHADAERERAILELLHELSAERQIVLYSQEVEVRAWAEQHLRAPRDAFVDLDRIATGLRRSA